MNGWKPVEEAALEAHLKSRWLAVATASSRLQAVLLVPNPTPYQPPPVSPTSSSFSHSPTQASAPEAERDAADGEQTLDPMASFTSSSDILPFTPGAGLVTRLESYLSDNPSSSIDPIFLSFHNVAVDPHSGLQVETLLLEVQAKDMEILKLAEVDLSKVDGSEGGGAHWMWIAMQKKDRMVDAESDCETASDAETRLNGGEDGWTAFGCPSEGMIKLGERVTPVDGDEGELFNHVELLCCFGGSPIFDGYNVDHHTWKPVLEAMKRGTCKVRYQYLYSPEAEDEDEDEDEDMEDEELENERPALRDITRETVIWA